MADQPGEGSAVRLIEQQRRFGKLLVAVGLVGLLLTPAVFMVGATVGGEASSSDELSDGERDELQEAVDSRDYGTIAEYSDLMGQFRELLIRSVLFGLPMVSLLLFVAGGLIITATTKRARRMDPEGQSANPRQRDEFQNDE